MDARRFPMILELKVSGLVEEMMRETGASIEDAVRSVYGSKLYRVLEDEGSKLWHHSPLALLECLKAELETGEPVFPDE